MLEKQRALDVRSFAIFALMCLSTWNWRVMASAPAIDNAYRMYGVVLATLCWAWAATAPEVQYVKRRNTVVTLYKFLMAALPMLRLPQFLQRRLEVDASDDWLSVLFLEPTRIVTGSRLVILLFLPVLLPQPLLGTFVTQVAFIFGTRNNESLVVQG